MSDINFSIIIPHYNVPDMLVILLESAPYDKEDVEVIVVDDRSTKKLEEFLEVKRKYEKFGVKFFRNNEGKKGPGRCRNIGMKHATGKWLIFADADDFFTKEMYFNISKYRNSDADMVYFTPDSINLDTGEKGNRLEGIRNAIRDYKETGDRRSELHIRYDAATPCTKLFSRQMVVSNGILFPEIMVSEDAVFACKCGYFAKTIEVSNEKFYVATERNESLTARHSPEHFKIQVDVFVQICKYIRSKLSAEDWRILSFNGNLKLIEAFQFYGIQWMLYVVLSFIFNGIKPVSFKDMSLKTAPGTLKKILEQKYK